MYIHTLFDLIMILALTKKEILAQGFLLFVAGYDTTSNGLSFLLYFLAINPDCQEKAREEVDRIVGDKVIETPLIKLISL